MCSTPPAQAVLRRELVAAFGPAGHELAEFQARTDSAPFDAAFSLGTCPLAQPDDDVAPGPVPALDTDGQHGFGSCAPTLNACAVRRGFPLLFVSSHAVRRQFEDLSGRINFLFPTKKNMDPRV